MLTATPEAEPAAPAPAALEPISADSVAFFRIGFGLLIAFSSFRFLAKGWVSSLYLEPANHLTYPLLDWVRPLPGVWMHLLVAGLGLCGLSIAAGYRHRLSRGLFLVGFVYTEAIEATLYLNHYWFLTVTALLLIALPVQHRWSMDARAGRVVQSATVPAITLWAIRAQLGVVYFFAGVSKLNPDWLLKAQPLQLWLADRTDTLIIGSMLDAPAVAYVASWSAALFDLTIVGWLLWKPSRKWAYAVLVIFHITTGALFQIGVFPWVMIVSTLVFFEPDWPRHLLARWQKPAVGKPHARLVSGTSIGRLATASLIALAVVQLILPLRHYAYDGNVRWTEDGYYLSWRVMLTDKAGFVRYEVTDPATQRTWEAGPELVLTDWQANSAATKPGLVHATAQLIADHYEAQGLVRVEVRAIAWVSMNGGPAEQLMDPSVDLANSDRTIGPSPHVLHRSN